MTRGEAKRIQKALFKFRL